MSLGLSNSQRGPWALDSPTACKDSKCVTAGLSMVPKYLEDTDPRREGGRAGTYIRSETSRNERKKTFKNKCNNFLMGTLHNWLFIFASFKASKIFSSFFPWTFLGGGAVLENPQLTGLVSVLHAIPYSMPANPGQQGHGSHLSPDWSP